MKIVTQDGRQFQGTAMQIVRAMQDTAFDANRFTVSEYVKWVVANTQDAEGLELRPQGETDEDLARSLLDELLRTGLARRL